MFGPDGRGFNMYSILYSPSQIRNLVLDLCLSFAFNLIINQGNKKKKLWLSMEVTHSLFRDIQPLHILK